MGCAALRLRRPTHDALLVSVNVAPGPTRACCSARHAAVVRVAAVTTLPATVALAERIGKERGADVDRPAWTDPYYSVARSGGT